MLCCLHCSQVSTRQFNIVTPDSDSAILLTTVNNVGSTTLFNLVIYLASPIITQTNNTYTQTFLSNPKTRKLQRNVHDCKIKPRFNFTIIHIHLICLKFYEPKLGNCLKTRHRPRQNLSKRSKYAEPLTFQGWTKR